MDWGTTSSDSRSLVTSFNTTKLLSYGNPSSRNQLHSLQLGLNIIWHALRLSCRGHLSLSDAKGHQIRAQIANASITVCIKWTNNVICGRERAKQIDIRKHFAHEAAQLGHLRLYRVSQSTAYQLADVFTESLHSKQYAAWVARISGRTRKGRGSSQEETRF